MSLASSFWRDVEYRYKNHGTTLKVGEGGGGGGLTSDSTSRVENTFHQGWGEASPPRALR